MLMNAFVALCVWIFLPMVHLTNRNNTFYKNGLLLSVTMPPQAVKDEAVQALCGEFRRTLWYMTFGLTATLLPAVFLSTSLSALWSMAWIPVAIAVCFRIYGRGYEKMKALKRRRGWQIASGTQVAAELRPVRLPKPVKSGWFVPPMILSVLPVLSCVLDDWDGSWTLLLAVTSGMGLLVTAMSLFFYRAIFRQRKDLLDDDLTLTEALTRVRRYNWTKLWLLTSWLTAGYSLAVWCCQGKSFWYNVWTAIYSVVLMAGVLMTEFSSRKAQQRLTRDRTNPVMVDEDDRWIWGQFYYNPQNPRAMINERVGIGMSINFAHPLGKVMGLCSVLLLLSLPILGIWLTVQETSPVELTVTDTQITARQAGDEYTVALDEITEAELLPQLPAMVRIWGTGLPDLEKGRYTVEGYGSCIVCLKPSEPPFLLLRTADAVYLFSGEPAQTIFARLE